ncbi:hypothetical protein OUZ56_032560 [Daphnia magna]|uniref:Uncharacterized protein n=1 Tax=Daphnia magna TaxID=35525 RepID=A0ABR0B9A3_9CRUS|nr:hypothetical protein OUZ56_032560 [Daphnia magna]
MRSGKVAHVAATGTPGAAGTAEACDRTRRIDGNVRKTGFRKNLPGNLVVFRHDPNVGRRRSVIEKAPIGGAGELPPLRRAGKNRRSGSERKVGRRDLSKRRIGPIFHDPERLFGAADVAREPHTEGSPARLRQDKRRRDAGACAWIDLKEAGRLSKDPPRNILDVGDPLPIDRHAEWRSNRTRANRRRQWNDRLRIWLKAVHFPRFAEGVNVPPCLRATVALIDGAVPRNKRRIGRLDHIGPRIDFRVEGGILGGVGHRARVEDVGAEFLQAEQDHRGERSANRTPSPTRKRRRGGGRKSQGAERSGRAEQTCCAPLHAPPRTGSALRDRRGGSNRSSPHSSEVYGRRPRAEHRPGERSASAVVAGRASDDHQREEMLFAWVCVACTGGVVPAGEPCIALGRRERCRLLEPTVEVGADVPARAPATELEGTHVVETHATSDDQHPLVAERRERASKGKVLARIQPFLERKLDRRDVGLRPCKLERHEGPVVEAAACVLRGGDVRRRQKRPHTRRELRVAGGRPGELVGSGREPVIIKQKRRIRARLDRRYRLFPVGRNHEECLRCVRQSGGDPLQVAGEALELVLRHPDVNEGPRPTTVRQKDHRQSPGRRPRFPAVRFRIHGGTAPAGRFATHVGRQGRRRNRRQPADNGTPRIGARSPGVSGGVENTASMDAAIRFVHGAIMRPCACRHERHEGPHAVAQRATRRRSVAEGGGDLVGERLQNLDPREVFVVGFDDRPRGGRRVGVVEHFASGPLIGVPFVAIAPVLRRDLKAFEARMFPFLKAFELLGLAHREPELGKHIAMLQELPLEVDDLLVTARPGPLAGEAFDALHEHAPVPRAVEEEDSSVPGERLPKTPKVGKCSLFWGGRGDRDDAVGTGIKGVGDPSDRPPFAGRIHPFKDDNDAAGGGARRFFSHSADPA